MSIDDLGTPQIRGLINRAMEFKHDFKDVKNKDGYSHLMKTQQLGMIFEKRSTRTRVSAEVAMNKLGGHALFLSSDDIQLGTNESIKDTALVLSRFCTLLMARVNRHEDVVNLGKESTIPVINGLSDMHHPLQALADYMTLVEYYGSEKLEGKILAWIGDGNNVCHDIMLAGAKLGLNLRIASPKGYEPHANVLKRVKEIAKKNESQVMQTIDAKEAVNDVDIVVTDTWVSMGQEEEYTKRLEAFEGYQVTKELMNTATKDSVFLHCLPRHQEEVTDQVFYSKNSLVFEEAENRMWIFMAVVTALLGK